MDVVEILNLAVHVCYLDVKRSNLDVKRTCRPIRAPILKFTNPDAECSNLADLCLGLDFKASLIAL